MPSSAAASVFFSPPVSPGWSLESLLKDSAVRQYSLARWALVDALRLCRAEKRRVLVPGFICRELLASLAVVGAAPVFYRVDESLALADDPRSLPDAAAIIAVNFFGFPQELSPFESYAERTGAVLIEDNAHGALSRDARGRALGSRAPLGLFSQRKTAPLASGGALAVNDPARFPKTPEALPPVGAAPGLSTFSGRRALRSFVPVIGPRNALRVIAAGRALRRWRTGAELPPPSPDGEQAIGIPPEPGPQSQFPIFQDPKREVERRRELYALSAEVLGNLPVKPVFSSLPNGVSPYGYPFRAAQEEMPDVEARLNEAGLFSLPWPDLPVDYAAKAATHEATAHLVHFQW